MEQQWKESPKEPTTAKYAAWIFSSSNSLRDVGYLKTL
jgi:hypothetical protein